MGCFPLIQLSVEVEFCLSLLTVPSASNSLHICFVPYSKKVTMKRTGLKPTPSKEATHVHFPRSHLLTVTPTHPHKLLRNKPDPK